MQLVAYGAQDIYLTGNPQITFFKVVYRRHTNFSMEAIQQTLSGTSTVANDATATCTISRNGDLVHKVYVVATCTADSADMEKLVKESEIEIGGQIIDKQTQEWRNVWNELSTPDSKAIGLKSMQGCVGSTRLTGGTGVNQVHVPLLFWFCRNPGLALPLIALQYHEVKIKLTWGALGGTAPSPIVYCDYIYLDTDERRRFAQVSHEYLIEQVQESSMTDKMTQDLHFNHPVKELIWTTSDNTYASALLKLNGHDRFSVRQNEYFQLQQPFDYHTAVPRQNLPSAAAATLDTGTNDVISSGKECVGSVTPAIGLNATPMTGVLFNLLSVADVLLAGTTDATYIQADAGGTAIVILGASSAALGMETTPKVGDLHLVSVTSTSATAPENGGTQIARVRALHMASTYTGAGEITVDKLVANGGAKDVGAIAATRLAADCLAIEYDTFVGGLASTATDRLTIQKLGGSQARTSKMTSKINVYSFALKPEEHQPSGTCNFSRIDNAQLIFTAAPATTTGKIYAVNYNVLRIMSGMGGLAYSN